MIVRGRGSRMPCESCAVQFSVFKRKRACTECERYYCSGCLRRGGGTMCAPCRVLSTRPLSRQTITHLKVRDLQCFLQRQNVSTRGCVEKEELVNLCITHVNSASYRRRGSRAGNSPFSSLKGLTNNFNEFINSAFDLRNHSTQQPPAPRGSCYNSSHAHSPGSTSPVDHAHYAANDVDRRFTTTPGGERDITVPVPEPALSASSSTESARVDTADCFEVEDLDDAGWEFVSRPAAPLPGDSAVLLAAAGPPARASSELALHRERPDSATDTDTNSLQDEPLMDHHAEGQVPGAGEADEEGEEGEGGGAGAGGGRQVSLEQLRQAGDLQRLSVRQLKELLTRNRVEFRGCLERADLLERATTLWHDHAKYKDEIDNLPIEECCKICMAAPLECVLLECGHIAACTACAKQLAECPICRQYVVRAVRFFRS